MGPFSLFFLWADLQLNSQHLSIVLEGAYMTDLRRGPNHMDFNYLQVLYPLLYLFSLLNSKSVNCKETVIGVCSSVSEASVIFCLFGSLKNCQGYYSIR